MKKLKIVVIGAGSADFGQGVLADFMTSKELKEFEVRLVLVDIDNVALDRMYRLANLIKDFHKSHVKIEAIPDRLKALPGADYVITSVAVRRWDLWQKDFFIPAAYGFKHVFGENGGPGAAFHTMRSLKIMIPICRDMERLCPDAYLFNYTNPESRVCLGVSKLTKIRNVGLCHGPMETLAKLGQLLDKPVEEIDMTIGGINHFHWVLKVTDKKTGKDLYPELDKKIYDFDWDADTLTPVLYKIFGLFPFPAPSHPGEYMNFAFDIAGPRFIHWGIGPISYSPSTKVTDLDFFIEGMSNTPSYTLWSQNQVERIDRVLSGDLPITDKDILLNKDITEPSREISISLICDMEFNRDRVEIGGNVMNKGFAISNLPEDVIIEVPIKANAEGIKPVKVGKLPDAIAGMCSTQAYIQNLLVEAFKKKSKKIFFQALLIDPIIDNVDRAEKMMETMLKAEAEYLPELS